MKIALFAALAALIGSIPVPAQFGRPGPPPGPIPTARGGILWYGILKEGLAEARRVNRPILLISAAPHCHNVSGVW